MTGKQWLLFLSVHWDCIHAAMRVLAHEHVVEAHYRLQGSCGRRPSGWAVKNEQLLLL